jgi:hypothetical protein
MLAQGLTMLLIQTLSGFFFKFLVMKTITASMPRYSRGFS